MILAVLAVICGCTGCGGSSRQPSESPSSEVSQSGEEGSSSQEEVGPATMSGTEISEYAKSRIGTVRSHNGAFDKNSSGSGFFIDGDGRFVTNYHVITYSDKLTVELDSGGSYDVDKVIDISEKYDLALLQVHISGNDYFDLSSNVSQGEQVYAIGSALGELTGTMTSGIVSNVSRTLGAIDCIQMDASISPGNSGGPLLNSFGQVIGINSYSVSNGNNLNLAINVDMLKNLDKDRNFTQNDYIEWWRTEIARSYRPTIINDNNRYTYSIINTYQSQTGEDCILSMNDLLDTRYGSSAGYDTNYSVYVYEYSKDGYDDYIQYMKEMGFQYDSDNSKEMPEGSLSVYTNPANGMVMRLFVSTEAKYLRIQTLAVPD